MWAQETHRAQVFINCIYIYIYIHTTQSAEIWRKQDDYKALYSLPGCHQNGFVATQALGHMMYVMYSELLHCI